MLDFRINNESLDLLPGAQLEVEENNPFLQLGEVVLGEYSLPIEAPLTAKNIRLLKYAGIYQKRIEGAIDATAFDTGFQLSAGKLKIEKVLHNLNRSQNGSASLYYLTGTSYFWQDLKGRKLREINLGGVRSFPFDNFNRAGNGFWGHIHAVVDAVPGTYPYAFYSALADGVDWVDGDVTINAMVQSSGKPTFFGSAVSDGKQYIGIPNLIVPQVFLKPVLVKAVELCGWKLQGAVLDDPQFNRITFNTLRCIDWARPGLVHRMVVNFNVVDHLPDRTVSEFLLTLRNRFGWWYDIDRVARVVTIRELKDVLFSVVKDYTRKASPVIPRGVLSENVIYRLKNNSGSSAISLDGLVYEGATNDPGSLPAPGEALSEHVRLLKMENNYVICQYNEALSAWRWELYTPNNGDVVPGGATEEITGDSSVCGIERIPSVYGEYFPRITGSAFWPARSDDNQSHDFQFSFYYGKLADSSNRQWPFASHHIYDSRVQRVGTWSLALIGFTLAGEDVGLYARAWKSFLERLISNEEHEVTLELNRSEFMALKFSDVILINGVKLFIKTRKYVIPYKNVVTLNCLRIRQ